MLLTAALWLLGFLAVLVCGLVLFSAWIARRVEGAVPPVGRFIEIEGTRLHYLDEGSGPTIVFIHGLAAQMQHLTYALAERLRGEFRVVFVDRPGAGYSRRAPGASARLTAQADTIAAFMQALGLERPLVVGHSLGGAVALALALDHPDQVGGLALVAPLTHPQQEPPEALRGLAIRSPLMRRIISRTVATPMTMRHGQRTLAAIFAPDPVPADFGIRGAGLLNLRPSAFFNASNDLAGVVDDLPTMVTRYPTLDLPVGILFGTRDSILNPAVQGEPMLTAVPGATLDLIEGAGHMLPINWTARTARFIEAMAARVGASARAPV